jgi:hypothetical protein
VKYRLLLVREEEGLGGRPSFWACINKPSLTLSLPAGAASGADRSHSLGTPFCTFASCCVSRGRIVLTIGSCWRRQQSGGGVTRVRTRLFPFTMTTDKGLSFQEL